MLSPIDKTSRPVLIGGALVLVILLGLIDYLTGIEFSFSIFYFLPITAVAWYVGAQAGIFFSLLCAAAWLGADVLGGHVYSSPYILPWNALMRLGIFLTITFMIHYLKKNAAQVTDHRLLVQKRDTIIEASQRIIGIVAENIATHNSALLLWIAKQKKNKKKIPAIVESTARNIGANLSALTEICFSPSADTGLDLEQLSQSLHKRADGLKKENRMSQSKDAEVVKRSSSSLPSSPV